MDLKFNHWRDFYTADRKIYSQLAHRKSINEFGFWKIEIFYLSRHEAKALIVKVFRPSFGRS